VAPIAEVQCRNIAIISASDLPTIKYHFTFSELSNRASSGEISFDPVTQRDADLSLLVIFADGRLEQLPASGVWVTSNGDPLLLTDIPVSGNIYELVSEWDCEDIVVAVAGTIKTNQILLEAPVRRTRFSNISVLGSAFADSLIEILVDNDPFVVSAAEIRDSSPAISVATRTSLGDGAFSLASVFFSLHSSSF